VGVAALVGGTDVLHFGPRNHPDRDKYWAERGIIHHENTVTGAYQTMSVRKFLQRLVAVNDMIGNSTAELAASGFAHHDEIKRQQKFVEDGAALAHKAKEQGMPSSAEARREAKRRRPKSVVVAKGKYAF